MHPAGPPPLQNRSCPSPSIAPCPSPSPSLIQQQQHVLYAPITTLQACATSLHPHCLYTGIQRNPGLSGSSASLTNQVPIRQTKATKWQPKSKPLRSHQNQQPHHHHQHHHHQPNNQPQYCQPLPQQHVQQPLSYIPKPLVLFDQCQTNQSNPGAPPPGTSFLVASSTFANPPYGPGDPYSSASGLTLIPQPYFKPPDVPQAFCLLSERPQPPQHHHQSLPGQNKGSYYNISATNACSLQTINSKPGYQLTNATNPYLAGLTGGQINTGQAIPPSQIFQNTPVTMAFGAPSRDKLAMVSNVDVQDINCSKNFTIPGGIKQQQQLMTPRLENIEWPSETARETSNNMFEVLETGRTPRAPSSPILRNRQSSSTISKSQEERYSDESAASFDFTIEAEKMVSALCNTVSSNDLGKDEDRGRNDNSPSFSGAAGDNVTNKTNIWFADFCTEYGVSLGQNYRSASTQTQEIHEDCQQYPESIRKTIYWGCNEAENIVNSGNHRCRLKAGWLGDISSATRKAVTKSSTCFPIFSGDRTFVEDLINALLRISNGWLVLDNYLNKQHYPCLGEKIDTDLLNRFHSWEIATHNLLRELIKTFVKIEENNVLNCSTSLETVGRQENQSNNSFPGDVSLYTNSDLFDSSQRCLETISKINSDVRNDRDSTYTLQYVTQTSHPNFRSFEAQQQSQKESKLRSKWTITENLSSTLDSSKSVPDISFNHNDPGFSSGNRFRLKNTSNSSTKISSSHSLNAEFFHLRNKVMETMGNCSELERQRWGLKEHQYDFVFGSSRVPNSTANGSLSNEPLFKIRTAGTTYENAYTQRCLPRIDSTLAVNQNTTSQCTDMNGSVFIVSGAETALNSTYIAAGPSMNPNKTYIEPNYTGTVRIADCTEHNCGSGLVVSATSISSITSDPVYVGKSSSNQRELAVVPRTKMTLLSQIEGPTSTANRDTKEMTANLSAWFASIRNATGHRTIACPVEGKKTESTLTTRTSTHPQETSRSAMDLNRQLHMDGNRQLQTLQNMQTIQSQPWNACNLLNNKRTTSKVQNLDEYDSSEDVRVYMKPGSYNVPKKRHNRKNNRRSENPGTSRGNHTPRIHTSRGIGTTYNNSGAKNHQTSTSVSSLVISSSVQVSSSTTNTTTAIKVPFPATPIVPPPASFSLESSPRILRRAKSNQETRQDVAWKAACASAEILLEALNVKESCKGGNDAKRLQKNSDKSREQYLELNDESLDTKEIDEKVEVNLSGTSSYEASEDDSDSTCKFSPQSQIPMKSRNVKQTKTNVKTDSWLIRTLNNASIASKINNEESDAESTIGGSLNSSIHDDHKNVVTSTPEPIKNVINDNSSGSTVVAKNLDDSFQEKLPTESPRGSDSRERSNSSNRQALSISLIDTSAEFVGRATYSETVRRTPGQSSSTTKKDFARSRQTRSAGFSVPTIRNSVLPVSGKKCQRKENDKAFQMLHKTRKISGKRLARDPEEKDNEDGFSSKKIVKEDASSGDAAARVCVIKTKNKDDINLGLVETKSKPTDRGWSVWYSSRRRQTLSPLALDKLATIHQTVWQMEGAQVLKYPSTSSSSVGALTETIEDYCKIIKSPMFLETIGYKLKNRIYHKVEHVIRDFRRIISNSKLYHKNDNDRIAKVDSLSKKLEDLFVEHFATWDFENVLESPRDDNLCTAQSASRYKSPQHHQKSSTSCRFSTNAKKTTATISKNEN